MFGPLPWQSVKSLFLGWIPGGRFQEPLHWGRKNTPRRHIARLERRRDVETRPEEKLHIGQDISHSDGFDVGHPVWARFVRREYQRLVSWKIKVLFVELVPDELMYSVRISFGRWIRSITSR